MIDRHYFEAVLPVQLGSIGRPCRLSVHLQSGAEYDVAAIFAAHQDFVILEVHGSGEEPKRSAEWLREHPYESPWVYDQVTVPYRNIVATFLTPKGVGSEPDPSIGFRLRGEPA